MAVIGTEVVLTRDGGALRLRTHTDATEDRIHLASQYDESPVYLGAYDADCASCWLGHGHSERLHERSIQQG